MCGAFEAKGNRSPSSISSVNGTRNLTEALNQSQ